MLPSTNGSNFFIRYHIDIVLLLFEKSFFLIYISSEMAYGRGHASFTIDALKLAKDSLPAAVTEPPPVFPVSIFIEFSHVNIHERLFQYYFKGITQFSSSIN